MMIIISYILHIAQRRLPIVGDDTWHNNNLLSLKKIIFFFLRLKYNQHSNTNDVWAAKIKD